MIVAGFSGDRRLTPAWAVAAALAVSALVGVVFGLLPARQAAMLDPVEILGAGT